MLRRLFQYTRDVVCVETLERECRWILEENLAQTDLILATGRECRDHWWSTEWWLDIDSIKIIA